MSFGIVAGAAVGLVGSSISASATRSAGNKAAASQQAQLDFDMQRYNDWKDIYGSLQEDIGDHYKNLTGESLVGPELEQLQKSQQETEQKIRETMAQRGIEGGGLDAQLTADSIYNTESQKALARTTADQRAADAKQNFLALGLGQGNQIAGQMANSSRGLAATYQQNGASQASIINSATDNLTGMIGYGSRKYETGTNLQVLENF